MSRMSDASILVEEMLTTLAKVDRSMADFVLREVAKHYKGTVCPNCGIYRPIDTEYINASGWCFTCIDKADEARG